MILCCGEALIDMIPEATAGGAEGFVPHPGGAVFNTAIALGRLGAPAGMLTGLSTDPFGQRLAQALAESGVDARIAIRADRPTTLAFVTLAGGQASYFFYDENSAGRMLRAEDMPALPAEVSALFFGGVSLACEPCAEAYAALLARERGGRAVMIDPNIRPGFIADEAAYRDRLARMFAASDIVKVSDEDLAWLTPGADREADKAARLMAAGPVIVAVTAGSEGARAYSRAGAAASVPAQNVKVVDTVGAGDTFNAGLLSSLHEAGLLSPSALERISTEALAAALDLGIRAAAKTVARRGANPPYRAELTRPAV